MIKIVRNSLKLNYTIFQSSQKRMTDDDFALLSAQLELLKIIASVARINKEASMRKNIIDAPTIASSIPPLIDSIKAAGLLVNPRTNAMSVTLQPTVVMKEYFRLKRDLGNSETDFPIHLSRALYVVMYLGFSWKKPLDLSSSQLVSLNGLLDEILEVMIDPIETGYVKNSVLGSKDVVAEYLFKCLKTDLSLGVLNYALSNKVLNIGGDVGRDFRSYSNTVGASNLFFQPGAGVYNQTLAFYYMLLHNLFSDVYMPILEKYRKMMIMLQNRSKEMLINFFHDIPEDFPSLVNTDVAWMTPQYKKLGDRMKILTQTLAPDYEKHNFKLKDVDCIALRVFSTLISPTSAVDIDELPTEVKDALFDLIGSNFSSVSPHQIRLDWDDLIRKTYDKLQEDKYGYGMLTHDMMALEKRLKNEESYKPELLKKYTNGTTYSTFGSLLIDDLINIIPPDEISKCLLPTWMTCQFEIDKGYYQNFMIQREKKHKLKFKRRNVLKVLTKDGSQTVNSNVTLRVSLGMNVTNSDSFSIPSKLERAIIDVFNFVGVVDSSEAAKNCRIDSPSFDEIAKTVFLMRDASQFKVIEDQPRKLIIDNGHLFETSLLFNDQSEELRVRSEHNVSLAELLAQWLSLNEREIMLTKGIETMDYNDSQELLLVINEGTIYAITVAPELALRDTDIISLDELTADMPCISISVNTGVSLKKRSMKVYGIALTALKRMLPLTQMTTFDFTDPNSDFSTQVMSSFPHAVLVEKKISDSASLDIVELNTLPDDQSAIIPLSDIVPVASIAYEDKTPFITQSLSVDDFALANERSRFKGIPSFWSLAAITDEKQVDLDGDLVKSAKKKKKVTEKDGVVAKRVIQPLDFIFFLASATDMSVRSMIKHRLGVALLDEWFRLIKQAPCKKSEAELLSKSYNWNREEGEYKGVIQEIEKLKRQQNPEALTYDEFSSHMLSIIKADRASNASITPDHLLSVVYFLTPPSLLEKRFIFTENLVHFRKFGFGAYFTSFYNDLLAGKLSIIKNSYSRIQHPKYEFSDVRNNQTNYRGYAVHILTQIYNGFSGIFYEHTLAKNLKAPDLTNVLSIYEMFLFNADYDLFESRLREEWKARGISNQGFVQLVEFPDSKSHVIAVPYITMLNEMFMSSKTIYSKAQNAIMSQIDPTRDTDDAIDRECMEKRALDLLSIYLFNRLLNHNRVTRVLQ